MMDEVTEEKFKVVNHRISDLENEVKDIKDLTIAISTVNNKVDTLTDTVGEVKAGLKEIASKPGKRWDNAVWLVVAALIGYAVNFVLK